MQLNTGDDSGVLLAGKRMKLKLWHGESSQKSPSPLGLLFWSVNWLALRLRIAPRIVTRASGMPQSENRRRSSYGHRCQPRRNDPVQQYIYIIIERAFAASSLPEAPPSHSLPTADDPLLYSANTGPLTDGIRHPPNLT